MSMHERMTRSAGGNESGKRTAGLASRLRPASVRFGETRRPSHPGDRKVFATAIVAVAAFLLSSAGCRKSEEHGEHEEHREETHRIVVTRPVTKDVVNTQQYVSQIHSRRHIEVRALESGYLEEIHVQEGQAVKKGDPMFKIVPVLYKAKLDTEVAEAQVVQIEYENAKKLFEQNVVSEQELALLRAKLAKAQAQVQLAQAELNFTNITAPFDGIVDKQYEQQGSLIEEGDMLSTLSDNEAMWVYFNVPEARYLEYMQDSHKDDLKIELMLANHAKFSEPGRIGAIEAEFNNTTGNIAFRADFPNPDRLLRHGQTGTILIHRVVPDALVIPQRATYEILAKRYVYVVEDDEDDDGDREGVVRQRDITVRYEMDDVFVVESGLGRKDKIVLEGLRQVRDGEEVGYDYRDPRDVLADLKFHAE